jgi:hypothetical protein
MKRIVGAQCGSEQSLVLSLWPLRDSQALNLARPPCATSATTIESISLVTLSLKRGRPGSGGNFSTIEPVSQLATGRLWYMWNSPSRVQPFAA